MQIGTVFWGYTLDQDKERDPIDRFSRNDGTTENERAGKTLRGEPTAVTSTDHLLCRSPLIFSRFLGFRALSTDSRAHCISTRATNVIGTDVLATIKSKNWVHSSPVTKPMVNWNIIRRWRNAIRRQREKIIVVSVLNIAILSLKSIQ